MILPDTIRPTVTLVTVKAPSTVQIPDDVALVLKFDSAWGNYPVPTVKMHWISSGPDSTTIPSSWTSTVDNANNTITYVTENNTIVFPQSYYSAGSTVKIWIDGIAQPTEAEYYNEFNDV